MRHLATGRDLPEGAANVMNLWQGFIEQSAGDTLNDMDALLDDQAAFAQLSRQLIRDLGYGDQLGDDPDDIDDDARGRRRRERRRRERARQLRSGR